MNLAAEGRTGCGARSKLDGATLPKTSGSGERARILSAASEAVSEPLIAATRPIAVLDFIEVLAAALTPIVASSPIPIISMAASA